MKKIILGLFILATCLFSEDASAGVFFDDFNDGNIDGWMFVSRDDRAGNPALNWSIENGRLLENSGWDAQFALVENLPLSSQRIETRADILAFAGIAIWYKDLNNFVTIAKYPGGNGIYVGELFNGIGYGATYPYYGNQSVLFDFKADADSSTGELDFFVGGEYIFTYIAQMNVRTGLSGLVGGNGGGYFDDFRLTSEDISLIPEPSSFLLLGLGGLLLKRKKERKA